MLKKRIYTSAKFVDETEARRIFIAYIEFMATKNYSPLYLSIGYVLYENNIIRGVHVSFTFITKNKTYMVNDQMRRFIYYKIKDDMFYRYRIFKEDGYIYNKADTVNLHTRGLRQFLLRINGGSIQVDATSQKPAIIGNSALHLTEERFNKDKRFMSDIMEVPW